MASPDEKERKRRRMKNKWAKDLRTPKYRQKVEEDKKKKIRVQDLNHADLVRIINEETNDGN